MAGVLARGSDKKLATNSIVMASMGLALRGGGVCDASEQKAEDGGDLSKRELWWCYESGHVSFFYSVPSHSTTCRPHDSYCLRTAY